MTRVTIMRRGAYIIGFVVRGHSGYAESGSDIVCSAVSALAQTAQLGLSERLGIAVKVRIDDASGSMALKLPGSVRGIQLRRAQILFDTLVLGIKSIELSYPEFVSIKEWRRR